MIDEIEILDANYSGLEEKLPDGLKLDTNSDVVLLLGSNNVGKTAFLRMLATSFQFKKAFVENEISHHWDYSAIGANTVSDVIEPLKQAKELETDWFKFRYGEDSSFQDFCERRELLSKTDTKQILVSNKSTNGLTVGQYFFSISREARDRLLKVEDELRLRTDENIWGFVKPTVSGEGEIYFQ